MNLISTLKLLRISFSQLTMAACTVVFASNVQMACAQSGIWNDVEPKAMTGTGKSYIVPMHYRALSFNMNSLRSYLAGAPMESANGNHVKNFYFTFPMPDGSSQKFYIVESPVMAPELAAKFPEIKTYAGQGIDDPTATVRFDYTPAGFHAQILSVHGSYYIDPYFFGESNYHISYNKKDYFPAKTLPPCGAMQEQPIDNSIRTQFAEPVEKGFQSGTGPVAGKSIGAQLRKYDLALAATGEYTQFHGGTQANALAAMNTSINRVDGIYERELAIRMVLVANTNLLIYTSPNTDPYDNNNGGTMLGQNQTNVTSIIGTFNFDIGHVFSTGGGGIAGLGVVCNNATKARGVTGSPAPVGDPFDVDYVAHEMGHQFGGNHTFNCTTSSCGFGNRSGNSAYEPGSGSTIMSYAGICGSTNDLQAHSDPIFHTKSFDEITIFSQSGAGNGCATITATGNNPPVINPGANYIVPYMTPFKLTGSATDADGDTISYCWEEFDVDPGAPCNWNQPNGNAPIFRTWNPTLSPTRLFPKLSSVLANTQSVKGEWMASYARTLHFKLTCRDNQFGGGGVTNNDNPVTVQVINTGTPFAVTSPNTTGITYCALTLQTITWNVGGTDVSPISTPNVFIYLSTDGGLTFPTCIGYNVPNSGSYQWWTPNINTSQARIMIEGSNNAFFDINDKNFAIACVGVSENDLSASVNVYPNPGNDLFYYAIDNNSRGPVQVKIFDKLGRVVSSRQINKTEDKVNFQLDLNNSGSGLYSVEFTFNEGRIVKRLVKL